MEEDDFIKKIMEELDPNLKHVIDKTRKAAQSKEYSKKTLGSAKHQTGTSSEVLLTVLDSFAQAALLAREKELTDLPRTEHKVSKKNRQSPVQTNSYATEQGNRTRSVSHSW